MNSLVLNKISINKEKIITIVIIISLMTLGSKISFMVPGVLIPVTLQTLALMYIGMTTKKEDAILGMTTWVMLVAMGMPLASGVAMAIITPSFGFY